MYLQLKDFSSGEFLPFCNTCFVTKSLFTIILAKTQNQEIAKIITIVKNMKWCIRFFTFVFGIFQI
jgi:hypothetical protein